MTKELVVSTYCRDYKESIKDINSNVQITVYRKGDIHNLQEMEIYIPSNLGREVHTYYYHLVNRYYTLSDITFFSQDYFYDHVNNYIEIINGDRDVWNKNGTLWDDGCWFFNTGLADKPTRTLDSDKYGLPYHNLGNELIEIWDILFDEPCPQKITFSTGGHFAITREGAHKIPLRVYRKVLELLETRESMPWVMERLNTYVNLKLAKFKE
jgi:hypothetical protein